MIKRENITPEIPTEALQSLARCILPKIREYYESEDGRREFEEWKTKQAA
ncbi:MAG: hypothetical protein LBD23_06135 [Oscillospiraceae bacterium]|nr:hypothetical protein [Oscillospiraceae bacterium]